MSDWIYSTAPYASHGFMGRDACMVADMLLGRSRHNDPEAAARIRAERLARKAKSAPSPGRGDGEGK